MSQRVGSFILFFCLLFAGGTLLLAQGQFSAGVLLGALLTALVIALIIKPRD